MAYNTNAFVNLGGLKSALTQIREDYIAKIAAIEDTVGITTEVVAEVPTAESASENVIYLVLNGENYDMYMLVDGAIAQLNESASAGTITESDIATDDEVAEMMAEILGTTTEDSGEQTEG